jgi:hypothetical protein
MDVFEDIVMVNYADFDGEKPLLMYDDSCYWTLA